MSASAERHRVGPLLALDRIIHRKTRGVSHLQHQLSSLKDAGLRIEAIGDQWRIAAHITKAGDVRCGRRERRSHRHRQRIHDLCHRTGVFQRLLRAIVGVVLRGVALAVPPAAQHVAGFQKPIEFDEENVLVEGADERSAAVAEIVQRRPLEARGLRIRR